MENGEGVGPLCQRVVVAADSATTRLKFSFVVFFFVPSASDFWDCRGERLGHFSLCALRK